MVGVFKGPVCDDEAYRFYFFSTIPWYDTLRSDNTNHSKQRRRALSNICTNLLCYTSLLNIYIHTILFLHAKV